MIADDFKIDFENKMISYNPTFAKASAGKPKGSGAIYSVNELYSYLQDTFDEPANMRYDIPIQAKSKTKYLLINGWTISEEGLKHLKGGSLK